MCWRPAAIVFTLAQRHGGLTGVAFKSTTCTRQSPVSSGASSQAPRAGRSRFAGTSRRVDRHLGRRCLLAPHGQELVHGIATGFVTAVGADGAGSFSGGCCGPTVAIASCATLSVSRSRWHFLVYIVVVFIGVISAAFFPRHRARAASRAGRATEQREVLFLVEVVAQAIMPAAVPVISGGDIAVDVYGAHDFLDGFSAFLCRALDVYGVFDFLDGLLACSCSAMDVYGVLHFLGGVLACICRAVGDYHFSERVGSLSLVPDRLAGHYRAMGMCPQQYGCEAAV